MFVLTTLCLFIPPRIGSYTKDLSLHPCVWWQRCIICEATRLWQDRAHTAAMVRSESFKTYFLRIDLVRLIYKPVFELPHIWFAYSDDSDALKAAATPALCCIRSEHHTSWHTSKCCSMRAFLARANVSLHISCCFYYEYAESLFISVVLSGSTSPVVTFTFLHSCSVSLSHIPGWQFPLTLHMASLVHFL